jgi:hypothetical protein
VASTETGIVASQQPDREESILNLSQTLLEAAGSSGIAFNKDIEILFYTRSVEPKIADIVAGNLDASFERTAKKNHGYRDDNVWIKFQIANSEAADLKVILTMDSLVTDQIELFTKGNSQLLGKTGDMVPRSERVLDSLMLAFPLELPPQSVSTYYARIHTSSAKEMKMSVRTPRHFTTFEHDAIWILACLLGGFVIMFFYNLGVSMAIRSLDYIVYSLLILLAFIRESYLVGVFSYFVIPDHMELAGLIGRTSLAVSIAVVALFVVLFLDLSKKKGIFYWANLAIVATALLTAVLQLVLGPKAAIFKLILLQILTVSLLPIATSLYQLIKGSREARFFLLAWTVACAGFGANVLIAAGVMQAGAYGLSFGLGGQFLELILLSFAFADKVNRIRQDKIKATRQLSEQLHSFNQRLQIQVKEKTRDIQSILDNIHQGIMPIQLRENSTSSQPEFMIAEDHSAFLQYIIGISELAQQDPFAIFFRKTDISVDQINQIESTLYSMIGEPSLVYELNAHLLPRQAILHMEAGEKHLSMDWDAVVDEGSDRIVRILLVLKDVTEVRKLEEARQKQDKEIAIIGQIVKIDEVKYLEFLRLAEAYLIEAASILVQMTHSVPPFINEQKDQIYRLLHTVKGLSRTYMMTEISDAVHIAESTCHHWAASDRPTAEKVRELELGLRRTVEVLEEYKRLNFQVLGRRMEAVVRMDRSYIETAISTISRQLIAEDVDKIQIARVVYDFKKIYMKTIESLLDEDIKGLGNIAQKMGKVAPRFIFRTDSSLFLRREIEGPLHTAFTHSLRNSIDHGIEAPAERAMKGKQAQGQIFISSEMTSDGKSVVIEICDDGAGLKLDRIAAKACEAGLITSSELSAMSEENIADLVFQPGFSTARNLTDISGRGIGMDAIRKAITDLGGEVNIVLKGRLSDGAQTFVIRLVLPIQHFDIWRIEAMHQAA